MGKLTGKIAVITGGVSGIGKAAAKLFKEEGATVVVNARSDERLAEVKAQGNGYYDDLWKADVASVADLEGFYRSVAEKYGKIDVLFLNAGKAMFMPLEAWDEATFDHQFDVNVKGVFFGVQKALPYLSEGASVILNTSVVNKIGMANATAYSATKAAVRSMARTFSRELIGRGIRVNAVSPGPIETPIYSKLGMPDEAVKEFASGVAQQIPLGRFGTAEEVARVALFYASEDSSFVVGTEIEVDGGMTTI